jgi:integrase
LYEWLLSWLDKYEKDFIKRTTYVNYESYIKNYFRKIDMPICEVSAAMLQDFFNAQLESGLSAKTVHNMVAILKKAMKRAVINKVITENPTDNIELPKLKKPEIQILTEEQQSVLVQTSYHFRYGTFIRLTLCTGLRLGELLGLKWEDISFEMAELHVRRILHRCKNYDPYQKNSTSIFFDEPKTEKSKRVIPLPESALEDLKRWKEFQFQEVGNVEFVVTNQDGKYLDPTTFKKHYNRLLEKCNITGITFHALRHTFATRALEKGMNVKVLSEILGHYSVAFTMDTYAHVLTKFKRDNMELMNDVYIQSKQIKNIVLCFTPFKSQYIVSIPHYRQYTFIANSIQEGIDYAQEKKEKIVLPQAVDVKECLANKQDNEIIVCIN